MTIPARLHFCWIGSSLPWAYVFAILSAAERSELPEIILHHTESLQDDDRLRALQGRSGVRLARVDPCDLLASVGRLLDLGDGLAALYRGLDDPVMRSDVLRAAILYAQGGIYLDLDTVTVRSLLPLTGVRHFIGSESIVWPRYARISRSPVLLARHLMLDLVRKILRRLPQGWRVFRRIEGFYCRGVNNAVMGSEARSPLLAAYLRAMLRLSPERQRQRYGLGPSLLQEVVDGYGQDDLTIQEPRVFYPLAPEISEHWFRKARVAHLRKILSAETRVVHWYASVRTKSLVRQIDPGYVVEHRKHQLYSALVCACIRTLPAMA